MSEHLKDVLWITLLVIAAGAFVVINVVIGPLVFAVYWLLRLFVQFGEFYDALPPIFWVISAIAALGAGLVASIRIGGSAGRAALWSVLFGVLQFGVALCVAILFIQRDWLANWLSLAYWLSGWVAGVPVAFFCGAMAGNKIFKRWKAPLD